MTESLSLIEMHKLALEAADGSVSRQAVADRMAADKTPWRGYPPIIQDPSEQLELMLLAAALPSAAPHHEGPWWYRSMDLREAASQLMGPQKRVDLGDGWQQVLGKFDASGPSSWQANVAWVGDWTSLSERGGRLFRMPSDPGLSARVLLLSPSGEWVYVLSKIYPVAPYEPTGIVLCGSGTPDEQLIPALAFLEVDVGLVPIQTVTREGTAIPSYEQTFCVWRQDDNGQQFLVGRYVTRDAAARVEAHFDAKHHHQTYWVQDGGPWKSSYGPSQ